MATNHNPSNLPLPLLSTQFVLWVSSLKTDRERMLWCDECHYWHQTASECPYNGRATHPVGTNVRDIPHFDRGIKVRFSCREHPQYEYMSKEPGRSQWFPANEATQALQWGTPDECSHKWRDDVWFTTSPYSPEAGA